MDNINSNGFVLRQNMVRGSWFVVRGSWFVVRGAWFVVRGSGRVGLCMQIQ